MYEDAQRGKRNLSMAWIGVVKAYDSVDHGWLSEMFTLHRFPIWFAKVMEKLANSWNTRIVAQTTQGKEISPTIRFKVIPLKLFYYQTFLETWHNEHS